MSIWLVLLSGATGAIAQVVPVLQLSSATWSNNQFSVSFRSLISAQYRLWYTTSTNFASWTNYAWVWGTGGIQVLTDPAATNAQRSYRVEMVVE
jgi:hypothetical protein